MPGSSQTKRALAEALKQLMAGHPFQKISVGDICAVCSMSRKSFYYHFQDKYDLVNWIFYTEFIETLCDPNRLDSHSLLRDICEYFYREQAFYRRALEIRGQNCFQDYFIEVIRPYIRVLIEENFGARTQDTAFFVSFYSDAFLAAIIRWLNEGANLSPERLASLLTAALSHPGSSAPESLLPPSLPLSSL